jgi:hypothetical protein
MTQRYKDPHTGQIYEFPNDATPEEIDIATRENPSMSSRALQLALNIPKQLLSMAEQAPGAIGKTIVHPLGAAQDIGAGVARGAQHLATTLGETGQYIGDNPITRYINKNVIPNRMKFVPDVDVREEMGLGKNYPVDLGSYIESKNPNSLLEGIGQYGMGGTLGRRNLISQMLTNAGWAATQAEPGERWQDAITAAGLVGSVPLIGKSLKAGKGAASTIGKGVAGNINASKTAARNVKDIFDTAREAPTPLTYQPIPLPEPKPLPEFQGLPPPELPARQPSQPLQLPQRQQLPELTLPESKTMEPKTEFIGEAPKKADDLLQILGKGATNKEQAAKMASSILREKYNQRIEEAGIYFNHVFQQAGNNLLYKHIDPLISTELDKKSAILDRLKGINIKPLYEKFKNNPTIENGHLLKSELGTAIGDLEKNTQKTPADRETISSIRGIRKTIENDIFDALERHDSNSNENLLQKYKKGIELHKENVEPFRSTPELRDITVNGVETPKNIESVFNTPTDIIKNGERKTGGINKVLSDVSPEFKDLILFNKIGASKYAGQPDKLVESLLSAKNEGYSTLFNQHVNDSIEAIQKQSASDVEAKIQHDESYKANMKDKEQALSKAIAESKSKHANEISDIKIEHAQAIKKAMSDYKAREDIAKAEHKLMQEKVKLEYRSKNMDLLEKHRALVKNEQAQHKLDTDKVKLLNKQEAERIRNLNDEQNRRYERAYSNRKWLIGGSLGAALPIAGSIYSGYHRLNDNQ